MKNNAFIVQELRAWVADNRAALEREFISIIDKLPKIEDRQQTKGCVGLEKGKILVSFTVWDRNPIQLEILVYSTDIEKTVVMSDHSLTTASDVVLELNRSLALLKAGWYDSLEPDPSILNKGLA